MESSSGVEAQESSFSRPFLPGPLLMQPFLWEMQRKGAEERREDVETDEVKEDVH